jgi:hypothetical protein
VSIPLFDWALLSPCVDAMDGGAIVLHLRRPVRGNKSGCPRHLRHGHLKSKDAKRVSAGYTTKARLGPGYQPWPSASSENYRLFIEVGRYCLTFA